MNRDYRACTYCVMDTSDVAITFDTDGRCNHCTRAETLLKLTPRTKAEGEARLAALVAQIQRRAPTTEYQCLIGLSGGVDSSYVAWLAHRLGLRVLAVHCDNGWNAEVAVGNIQTLCERLEIDLMTYVINWEEFRDLQRSFLRASVVDVELVTDHAIFAAMVRLAREHRIPFVLGGGNLATESILPRSWVWPKQDLRNIKAIHRRFGSQPLNSYPTCGVLRWSLLRYSPLGTDFVEILNYACYRRDEALSVLEQQLGWRSYGGKHHESVFTRFYQEYLLPEKFGVDKRRAHLSSLIVNGELTRAGAVAQLEERPADAPGLSEAKAYVLKKLGLSDHEFAAIMSRPPRSHSEYPSDAMIFRVLDRYRDRARRRALRNSNV
jgi:N-acetyl sugar amidotransferase